MNTIIEISIGMLFIFLSIGLFIGYIAAFIYFKPKGIGTWISINEAEDNMLYYNRLLNDKDFCEEMPEKELEYIHGKLNVWADIYGIILKNDKNRIAKLSSEDKKEILDSIKKQIEK